MKGSGFQPKFSSANRVLGLPPHEECVVRFLGGLPLLPLLLLPLLLLACTDSALDEEATSVEERTDEVTTESTPSAEATDGRRPRHAIVEALRADLVAERHPSDGGGRAWIEAGPSPATSGEPGTWTLVFEVGPEGVAEGGVVFLQISPFWDWTPPQVERPGAPGYVEVLFEDAVGDTAKSGPAPTLRPEIVDDRLLAVTVEGRALVSGERIRFAYGEALPDRYAETGERFWIAVDGDGDGVRELIDEMPEITIQPGPAARLVATLPSTARPGETVRLHLAFLDEQGSAGVEVEGDVTLSVAGEGGDLGVELSTVRFSPGSTGDAPAGVRVVELVPRESGILRLRAEGPGGRVAESNPLQVAEGSLRVYWVDLQNHSNRSDGTGRPEELYRYARDVAGLDVVSVTDHDHWGLRALDGDEATWREIQRTTEAFHEPGRFVTVRGYEWTNWIHGHRHVLVFDDEPLPIFSAIDPDYDHPEELWAALAGRRAITVAHHSAGGPISTDWTIAPDPELEPVTEIVSVHGSSEAVDSPKRIYRHAPGNFVRGAALGRGYRLGFLGSSDGHDGHPGLAHVATGVSGLGAILSEHEPSEALTRGAVYRALMERRTYATSGPRILLRAVYGGYRMGAEVPLEGGVAAARGSSRSVDVFPADRLFVQVFAPGALERVDVIRSGELIGAPACEARLECTFLVPVTDLEPGDWLYVRAVQVDGHFAVSSPFFFVEKDAE